ncbi:MAG: hypothetical protein ABIT38_04700 [Gemmatimonadaceae bacterium]
MTPRWESPLDRPSSRDTALLAEVLGTLSDRLAEPVPAEVNSEELTELISAAMAELHRVDSRVRFEGGVAPVLGAGVLQELIRRRLHPETSLAEPATRSVDHRL